MLFTALISAVALIVAVAIAIPLTVTRRNMKNQVGPDTMQGSSKFFMSIFYILQYINLIFPILLMLIERNWIVYKRIVQNNMSGFHHYLRLTLIRVVL
jgi:hypothetical protein